MWAILLFTFILSYAAPKDLVKKVKRETMFSENQIVFKSDFNITKILVPADPKFIQSNDIPSIFFTVSDPKLEGGSCIYVLEGLAAYEVLEGGRDSTADIGHDNEVYFGGVDGVYKYNHDSLSAKRFGIFKDSIIQLQKANGSDALYILTEEHRMYKLEKRGTVKTRIEPIVCASEFVLDTSNNIYYIDCKDKMIHIVKSNGRILSLEPSVMDDFNYIKLIRPAFIMQQSIPFFGDGDLYILYSNGTSERKDFHINEKPSAISIDATLYLVAALNGKIYEFNVMEVLLKSMFGVVGEWPKDVSKIVISMMESARDGFLNHYDLIL